MHHRAPSCGRIKFHFRLSKSNSQQTRILVKVVSFESPEFETWPNANTPPSLRLMINISTFDDRRQFKERRRSRVEWRHEWLNEPRLSPDFHSAAPPLPRVAPECFANARKPTACPTLPYLTLPYLTLPYPNNSKVPPVRTPLFSSPTNGRCSCVPLDSSSSRLTQLHSQPPSSGFHSSFSTVSKR